MSQKYIIEPKLKGELIAGTKGEGSLAYVGKIAEAEGHHPDLWFGWGYARIKIFTHAIKGLAESDFSLAAKIDKIISA